MQCEAMLACLEACDYDLHNYNDRAILTSCGASIVAIAVVLFSSLDFLLSILSELLYLCLPANMQRNSMVCFENL